MNEALTREIVQATLLNRGMDNDEWAHRIVIDEVAKRNPQTTWAAVEAIKDGLRQYPVLNLTHVW